MFPRKEASGRRAFHKGHSGACACALAAERSPRGRKPAAEFAKQGKHLFLIVCALEIRNRKTQKPRKEGEKERERPLGERRNTRATETRSRSFITLRQALSYLHCRDKNKRRETGRSSHSDDADVRDRSRRQRLLKAATLSSLVETPPSDLPPPSGLTLKIDPPPFPLPFLHPIPLKPLRLGSDDDDDDDG